MAEYMAKAKEALGKLDGAPVGHQESQRRLALSKAAIYAQLAVAEQLGALVGLLDKSVVGLEEEE